MQLHSPPTKDFSGESHTTLAILQCAVLLECLELLAAPVQSITIDGLLLLGNCASLVRLDLVQHLRGLPVALIAHLDGTSTETLYL